jgi:hypothetical protein
MQRILNESKCSIPYLKANVRDIVDRLLRDHKGDAVGKN